MSYYYYVLWEIEHVRRQINYNFLIISGMHIRAFVVEKLSLGTWSQINVFIISCFGSSNQSSFNHESIGLVGVEGVPVTGGRFSRAAAWSMVGLLGKVLAKTNNKTGKHIRWEQREHLRCLFQMNGWKKYSYLNVNVNFFIFFLEFDWLVPLNDIILSMTLKSYSFLSQYLIYWHAFCSFSFCFVWLVNTILIF